MASPRRRGLGIRGLGWGTKASSAACDEISARDPPAGKVNHYQAYLCISCGGHGPIIKVRDASSALTETDSLCVQAPVTAPAGGTG